MFCLKICRNTKEVFKIIDTFARYSTVQFDTNVPSSQHLSRAVPPAALLHLLAKQNIDYVFGSSFLQELLPITELYYMCKYVECRSAMDAGFFAGGFARSTGNTGVVLVSGMDGVLGMMTPLLDAKLDGIPLLMLSVAENQDIPSSFRQDQATEITKHLTKESLSLSDISTQFEVMKQAFDITTGERPGPVHVHLNLDNETLKESSQSRHSKTNNLKDMGNAGSPFNWNVKEIPSDRILGNQNNLGSSNSQSETTSLLDATILTKSTDTSEDENTYIYRNGHLLSGGSALAFQEIADFINKAEKPVIIAGHGCQNAAEELRCFVERANIPVCTTLLGIGTLNTEHKLSLNWCGVFGFPAANTLLEEATLIIAVGSRFDERCIGVASLFGKRAREAQRRGEGGFIHCDIRKSELDRIVSCNYFINSACKHFISNMNKLVEFRERSEWFSKIEEVKGRLDNRTWLGVKEEAGNESLTERNVLSCLNRYVAKNRDNTIITAGIGMHQMVAAQELTFRNPRSFLTSGSAATMGACLGYAVGTKYGKWSKDVICVIGDGDFNMSLSTFETIAEYRIPIKILLLNNSSLLMIEIAQRLMFDGRLMGVENPPCDYKLLADAVGMKSIHCKDLSELDGKMSAFLRCKEPVLLHVDVGKHERVGYVPFNRALDEMIVFKMPNNSE